MTVLIAIPGRPAREVVARELTDAEQHRIAAALADDGIRIEPVMDIFHTLHLWAQAPTTTAQEVTVLRAFRAETDCRLAWHEAVPRG